MTPTGTDTGGRSVEWGLWEAGAVAVLFSLPAAVHLSALHWAQRMRLDAFEWLVIALALVAAVVLSLLAGGVSRARSFLSVGLITCCAWTFGGVTFGRGTGMDVTYFVLAVLTFTGQINLVPVALLGILREGERALGPRARVSLDRPVFGSIACVAMLDLFPVVFLLSRARADGYVTIGWIAGWAIAAGIFAGMAAHALPSRAAAASAPPARGDGRGNVS